MRMKDENQRKGSKMRIKDENQR